MKFTYFELFQPLYIDTYLSVKLGNKWVHYIIPVVRKDGTTRTYGDLYKYFTQKKDFRMACGYILQETLCNKFWKGQIQYLYFDKNRAPYLIEDKKLKHPLLFAKNQSRLRA